MINLPIISLLTDGDGISVVLLVVLPIVALIIGGIVGFIICLVLPQQKDNWYTISISK